MITICTFKGLLQILLFLFNPGKGDFCCLEGMCFHDSDFQKGILGFI